MSTAVLLSIKPEFTFAIFRGDKRYEFRKVVFKNREVNKVYVYASAPVSRVIGVFYIDNILEMEPKELWSLTCCGAGISEEFFYEYFSGKERGYALSVEKTDLFDEPKELKYLFGIHHPPQSFRYVANGARSKTEF